MLTASTLVRLALISGLVDLRFFQLTYPHWCKNVKIKAGLYPGDFIE